MAVFWKPDSLKAMNEKKQQEQTQKDEISEIQDALMEIAEMVATVTNVLAAAEETSGKEAEDNG